MSTEECGFGEFNVTILNHVTVSTRDGVRLSTRIYIPDKLSDGNFSDVFEFFNAYEDKTEIVKDKANFDARRKLFPTIIENVPYYKDDYTAQRDYSRHNWFCSHGFVCVRAEIRGSGASEGLYYGEYLPQEQKDLEDVIRFLQSQRWSNKKIGMYGKSWGGFNSLQMAFHQNTSSLVRDRLLTTAISLYSTDDRYNDDIHYQNGIVVGSEMLPWAAQMFRWNARPPPPRYFESYKEWKSVWLYRLNNASQSWLTEWLQHQSEDDIYWKHGSIKQDYSKIDIPFFILGGLEDGYRSAQYRMSRKLNDQCKFMIGSWGHQWPDDSNLGPTLYYLNLCKDWFTSHLANDEELKDKTDCWPRIQIFVRDSFKPEDLKSGDAPGKMIKFDKTKSENDRVVLKEPKKDMQSNENFGVYHFDKHEISETFPSTADVKVLLKPHVYQGYSPGAYASFGRNTDFSYNQKLALDNSLAYYTSELENDLYMVGDSTMFIGLYSSTWDRVHIHVKVCDVFPDGSATLISRCIYHLSNDGTYFTAAEDSSPINLRHPNSRIYPLKMSLASHCFKPGHRVSISIAPSAFPYMWPSCSKDEVYFLPGSSYFVFEKISLSYAEQNTVSYLPPKPLLKIQQERLSPAKSEIKENVSAGIYSTELYNDDGCSYLPNFGIRRQEKSCLSYETDRDVTYGSVQVKSTLKMGFDKFIHCDSSKSQYDVEIQTVMKMSGSYDTYDLYESIDIKLGDKPFWNKEWSNTVPRHQL